MAPIPRLAAAGPLSIITTALFSAFSGPNSSPPTNGSAAAVWDAKYTGTASFFNLTADSTPSPIASPTTPSKNATAAPTSPTLVYYNSTASTYTGCDNKTFYPTDNVALINSLQFGEVSSANSTCGQWIQVFNRVNTDESIYAKIVGVCDDCEYGSVALNREALMGLSYETPFESMVFDNESTLTIGNLTDSENPLPSTTPISPKNLLKIVWNLSEAPKQSNPTTVNPVQPTKTATIPAVVPTITKTTTTTTKTTTTKTAKPTPKPTSNPGNGGSWYTGRATWYSDTHGQCEHNYSQSDMIVAVNEAQMGKGKNICGKKILVTEKNSNTQVVVTVVDMCPSQYCNFGDLDLSQGAFKKFAGLGVGVLKLTWTFM